MASTLERRLTAALHSRISRGLPDYDIYSASDLALVDFTSNDYLALSKSSELKQALYQNLQSTPDILLVMAGHDFSTSCSISYLQQGVRCNGRYVFSLVHAQHGLAEQSLHSCSRAVTRSEVHDVSP